MRIPVRWFGAFAVVLLACGAGVLMEAHAGPAEPAEAAEPSGGAAAEEAEVEVEHPEAASAEPALESSTAKLSYCLGADIGTNLRRQSIEIDVELFTRALEAALAGEDLAMSPEEMKRFMTAWQQQQRARMQQQRQEMGRENKAEGEEFLAENAEKEGVVTLPSGLQYKVLREGAGAQPDPEDEVVVNYTGTLIDGTVFDSSAQRGRPAEFPVNGVIKGWTEALSKMKVGGKWKLFIPPELAYGQRGAGQAIGPNETLIFEVELLEIKPEAEQAGGEADRPAGDAGDDAE